MDGCVGTAGQDHYLRRIKAMGWWLWRVRLHRMQPKPGFMAAGALPGTNLCWYRLEADCLFRRHGNGAYRSADGHCYPNCNHYFHSYSDRNAHADADSVSDSNTFTNAHRNANPKSDSYIYTNANPDILDAK